MNSKIKKKPRVPAKIIERLEAMERRLKSLTDPEDRQCSVDPGHKVGVRGYVDSWIKTDLDRVLRWSRGEE